MNAFEVLGISETTDVREIKRAYALRLKQIDQERQPAEFQRLRQAYEYATARSNPRGNAEHIRLEPAGQTIVRAAEPVRVLSLQLPEQAPAVDQTSVAATAARASKEFVDNALAGDHRLGYKQLLQAALRSDEMQALEFREHFEQSLIAMLLQSTDTNVAQLAKDCGEVLNWGDKRHPLWRGGGLAALSNRIAQINRDAKASSARDEFVAIRAGKRSGNRKLCLELLCGPPRPWYFRWVSLRKERLLVMADLLKYIADMDPRFFTREANKESVRWWHTAVMFGRPTLSTILVAAILGFVTWAISLDLVPRHWWGPRDYRDVAQAAWMIVVMGSALGIPYLFHSLRRWWNGERGRAFAGRLARLRNDPRGIAGVLATYCLIVGLTLLAPYMQLRILAFIAGQGLVFGWVGPGRWLGTLIGSIFWTVLAFAGLAHLGMDEVSTALAGNLIAVAALLALITLLNRLLTGRRPASWHKHLVNVVLWLLPIVGLILYAALGGLAGLDLESSRIPGVIGPIAFFVLVGVARQAMSPAKKS